MDISLFLIIALLIAIIINILITVYLLRKKAPPDDNTIHQRLDSISQNVTDNLNNVTSSLLNQMSQLNQRIDDRLEKSTQEVSTRMDRANDLTKEVSSNISALKENSERIYEVGKDVSSLQELLKAPKLRGGLGEFLLSDLLSQVLPTKHFSLQYPFKSGVIVDAAILLRDNLIVSIDSKFPLENFTKMVSCTDEKETGDYKKLFKRDLRKHIDDISSKYILPDEKTLDIAFMYIPSENVYYETIIKETDEDSIFNYCVTKKVIPVSPNTLYVYLQTISMGLRGMRIEQRAKQIMDDIKGLELNLNHFQKDFNTLGKHISNANNAYTTSNSGLQKLSTKLYLIENHVEDAQETIQISLEETN